MLVYLQVRRIPKPEQPNWSSKSSLLNPLPGKQVILPGEHGDMIAKQAVDSNEIEIADAIWEQLSNLC